MMAEDKTESLSNQTFLIRPTKELACQAHCWHGKVRLTFSIHSPYTMSFMINLGKKDSITLMNQIEKAIMDIRENGNT